ncbi:MAG: DUF2911 domain-containing protein [Acidobacteriia bacterium]|nr:DUF2911 domain-containing protein [Terriglobia bacterium]
MKSKLIVLGVSILTLLLSLPRLVQAQPKQPAIVAFGSDSPERGTTRVGYWNTQKNMGTGQFAVNYGRPVWNKDYEDPAKFDPMTKGKTWRMGSNFWTVLDTDMPLKISGKTVPAGLWYLGLHRSEDGKQWSLAFIDPVKARREHVDASEIGRAPTEFMVPVTMDPPGDLKEKLAIDLVFKRPDIQNVTLKIAWGTLRLSAPIIVPVPTGS